MPKKRTPGDAFGLSLLDVLSNALGGLILLVLIVAVTIKGNDLKRLYLPQEGRPGLYYTELKFDQEDLEPVENILLAQIRLIGDADRMAVPRLSGDVAQCTLLPSPVSEGTRISDWMAVRKGEVDGTWSIKLDESSGALPDSVAVMITIGQLVKCSEIRKVKNASLSLMQVVEKGDFNPEITIFDQTCNLY